MFSNYQWLLTLIVIACIGYLVVYGSSSTSIKEGLTQKCRYTGDAGGSRGVFVSAHLIGSGDHTMQLWETLGNAGGTIAVPTTVAVSSSSPQIKKAKSSSGTASRRINSILIDAGTTFTMYSGKNFTGSQWTRTGPLLIWAPTTPAGGGHAIAWTSATASDWVRMGGSQTPVSDARGGKVATQTQWTGWIDPGYTSTLPDGCKLEFLSQFDVVDDKAAGWPYWWLRYWPPSPGGGSFKIGICEANTCSCPNGTPATGAACTTKNPVKCASCKAGYTLNGTTCTPNTCTCSNGTPATGAACTKNKAVKCASCATGFHAVGDRCVANPQCSSYTCPPGRQYKSNYKQLGCQKATCKDSECCDPIPQPTCTSFTCPQNSTLNENPSSIPCVGKSCTDNDCCTPNPKPTCFGDNMKCPTNFYLKSNGQQIQCANYTCTPDECCSANPTCSTIQCGPKFHPKPPSTICASSTCESQECCTANPICLTYTCPAGMKQKSNVSSITCTGATCAAPECCSVISSSPPSPPPPGIPPPSNIYFPNSNFISFNNEAYEEHSSPSDPNEDSYSHYNGWTSPKESTLPRTNNMFAATNLPPPIGIASFNNRSYNQA